MSQGCSGGCSGDVPGCARFYRHPALSDLKLRPANASNDRRIQFVSGA